MHMLFRRNFQRHGFQTNIYACGVDLFNKPSGILGAGEFFLKIVKAKAIVDTLVQNAAQFTVPLYNADGAAACLIAAVCLAIVYGGLLYMGACVSTEYTPDSISNANLLLSIIRSSGGQIAIYGLCLSVVLACLTTAISQITAVADFYETATHGKLSYKVLVMIVPIVTTIVASFGLDTIVSLTSPWFSFFYPITLVMTILGIFEKKIPNDGAFKGAVYFTVIYAVLDLPHEYGFGFLDPVLNHIPLYGLGFGWIVPAIVGFIVGLIAWKGKGRTET